MTNKLLDEVDSDKNEEISFMDMLTFVKNEWKAIAIFGFLGAVLAIFYLFFTVKQYEAVAQIGVAQIVDASGNSRGMLIVEEPQLIISRMSLPTSYSDQTASNCGYDNHVDDLVKAIKFDLMKNVPNAIQLNAYGPSVEAAKFCANSVYEAIKNSQVETLAPYIQQNQILKKDYEYRLQKAEAVVSAAERSGAMAGVSYLATRDEIRYLKDQINSTSAKNIQQTHLLTPIYVDKHPVSPKRRPVFFAGLFGGIFMGLLFALARQMIIRSKTAKK